ncbi:hypothetical protein KR084_003740 [Drosophila pseudotakahashii]|nr:hypothetical protein KR084_003740 [Drosophila pseudotakahashii]
MLSRLLSVLKRRRRESSGGPIAGNGAVEPEADPLAQQFQAIVVVVDKVSGATDHQLYTAETSRIVT